MTSKTDIAVKQKQLDDLTNNLIAECNMPNWASCDADVEMAIWDVAYREAKRQLGIDGVFNEDN